ncbi:flagellar hook-associated protein FlgK [Methylomarinum vadi]|uniref:flagellar hook-associated protein FlgK n=1 Tax=Methylomarinum vadi TaxID=438855 RepID=UPI0004DF7BFA|nr:flagellar hook-associated protein FlgK [Methylomarinum vadi]
MTTGILGTALTGLKAFQRSLDTTSHNIANVNTEGYSRQRVELGTMPAQYTGAGYVGNGVKIENIARVYDQFINNQLRSSTSAYGEADRYRQLTEQIDNLLADPTTGMSPAIKNFFNAVNEVADDPSSIPARQVLLSEAEILTQRFATMNGRFGQVREEVNQDLNGVVDNINSYASAIADLNVRIAAEYGRPAGDQVPNDLMDERDRLLVKLGKLVDVSVVPTKSNMVSVFIGKGQSLVLDGTYNQLATQQSDLDPEHLEIALKQPDSTTQVITRQLSGGELSGILRFRDEVLDPSQQQLGAIAASMAMEFNAVHSGGYDLDGNEGLDFFAGIANKPVPVIATGNTGSISVSYDPDPAGFKNIAASDYRLDVSGAGPTYTLTRLSDNTSINLTIDGSGNLTASGSDVLPGITIATDGSLADGDSFLIRPAYFAAKNIAVGITDPRDIAAATNIDADGASVINGPMPGDNRNALALAGLENQLGMLGGTATFQDAYEQMVSEVGMQANEARISSSAQETLLNNAKESWSKVSGVNLDEEAANLIKFQQSYQAAAQVVAISNTLFDSLLNGLR